MSGLCYSVFIGGIKMVDKNEAPEGYEAVNSDNGCKGCAFDNGKGHMFCKSPNVDSCMFGYRADKESVIFVKKSEEDVMEFDKSRVYTALNAEEVKVGSKVIVADNLERLKNRVKGNVGVPLDTILDEHHTDRFVSGGNSWNLCYLIEAPIDSIYCVCLMSFNEAIIKVLLKAMCSKLFQKGYSGRQPYLSNYLLIDTKGFTFKGTSDVEKYDDAGNYKALSVTDALEGNY